MVPPPDSEERHGSSSLYELDVESNRYLVAHQDTASFEGGVPIQTEVFAIDLCNCGDRDPSVAPGILGRRVGPSTAKWTLRVTP